MPSICQAFPLSSPWPSRGPSATCQLCFRPGIIPLIGLTQFTQYLAGARVSVNGLLLKDLQSHISKTNKYLPDNSQFSISLHNGPHEFIVQARPTPFIMDSSPTYVRSVHPVAPTKARLNDCIFTEPTKCALLLTRDSERCLVAERGVSAALHRPEVRRNGT
jgi:hypothetical protein